MEGAQASVMAVNRTQAVCQARCTQVHRSHDMGLAHSALPTTPGTAVIFLSEETKEPQRGVGGSVQPHSCETPAGMQSPTVRARPRVGGRTLRS